MAFDIRLATVADLHAIMALETATFGTDAWSAHSMRAELVSKHTFYLVAVDLGAPQAPAADRLAGYAGLLAPLGSGNADIQTIAVTPVARGQGLGRLLMLALIAESRLRGAVFVFLEVRADNPIARSMYDSLGFEQIAIRAQYYQPDGVDAHIMRLSLEDADPFGVRRE
jgi:ribosomal-protein-alanine N-acetyltransferase